LAAVAILYTLRVDLLTFLHIKSPVSMNIIGVPASVAVPGIFGVQEHREKLLTFIQENEKGLLLVLNLEPGQPAERRASCRMLPTVIFQNRFKAWDDYVAHLRAPYRRRISTIHTKALKTENRNSDCSSFTPRHHRLYLDVQNHAKEKLETLTYGYFRNLPPSFRLSSDYRNGKLISWTITQERNRTLTYFFGGMDYTVSREYSAYFNGLLRMIQRCIDEGFHWLDLGQTAEIPKLRFGGRLVAKDMHLFHRNPAANWALRHSTGVLSWRSHVPSFHVMKQGGM
jgi:hypothetical protein